MIWIIWLNCSTNSSKCSTCTPEGHHPHGHQVDDVRLTCGELCQPHVKHADKDQRAESQDVTCRHRQTQEAVAHILRVRRQPAGNLTSRRVAGGYRQKSNYRNNWLCSELWVQVWLQRPFKQTTLLKRYQVEDATGAIFSLQTAGILSFHVGNTVQFGSNAS